MRQVPEIHLDGRRTERENVGIVGGKRTSDMSCAQHLGPEKIDGRVDMPKAGGMAA